MPPHVFHIFYMWHLNGSCDLSVWITRFPHMLCAVHICLKHCFWQ